MPQIGGFEILIIVVIAILVIGPKRLSFCFKKNWKLDWINKKIFHRYSTKCNKIR